jgi:2,2-dialkylglycine decarboxylase (pyruvate)
VGLTRSFHGLLSGISSVNFSMAHAGYGPLLPGAFALPAPYGYRCLVRHCDGSCDRTCLEAGVELVDQQSVGSLCAVVVEPVLSAGGVIVPPDGYLRRVHELCRERGMMLVLDEAQTGFGRLGTMFGFERDGIVPDFVAGLEDARRRRPTRGDDHLRRGGARLPREGIPACHLACLRPAPGRGRVAVLETIERESLVERARRNGDYLLAQLRSLQTEYEQIGEVRGRGLLAGVELVEDRWTKAAGGCARTGGDRRMPRAWAVDEHRPRRR